MIKPDDGHYRPKHVAFLIQERNIQLDTHSCVIDRAPNYTGSYTHNWNGTLHSDICNKWHQDQFQSQQHCTRHQNTPISQFHSSSFQNQTTDPKDQLSKRADNSKLQPVRRALISFPLVSKSYKQTNPHPTATTHHRCFLRMFRHATHVTISPYHR